jgi:capsular exopolysaccharide synthesis family protein
MSYIFDALQRSEAERSGRDLSSMELLELVEREAAAKLDGEPTVEPRKRSTPVEPFPIVRRSPDRSLPVDVTGELSAASRLAPADDGSEFFRECQPLHLKITPQNHLVSLSDSESPATEAFRLLSVRLRHLRRERQLQKVLITSTIPQEGKSVVSANLTCALASATRQRVLLVEGDVRRPTLSKVFGLKAHPGICEYLEGKRSVAASIYRLEPAGVWFFPAGAAPANPLELLEAGKLPALMEQLAGWFEWIIIDSPPILPLADTSVWTRMADGILLVTRQGTTQKRHLQRGLEALESKKVIGAVLNSSKSSADNDYYSYRRPAEGSTVN